ncbi:hypothetical protein Bequi_09760 [Brachybacterium sp. JHP9]|uniref:Uncharacterized protein n=1 Tax=Brachybacterium equifaecis TaxID=2910770 RepID=A0ABT0R2P5_9MICO|nr:hypothetical protein [Brachybacterium equifaecis]MCL6423668.1 hypothetical protein [Brachybacterium equifaecis]
MSTKISAGAESARENARKADGKFGSYQSPRADGVDLAGLAADPFAGRRNLSEIPEEERPRILVDVSRFEEDDRGNQFSMPREEVDITDYVQERPEILDQIASEYDIPLDGDLEGDDFSVYSYDSVHSDAVLEWSGVRGGSRGTDIDISGGVAKYLEQCRELNVRPLSDDADHEFRMRVRATTIRSEAAEEAKRAIQKAVAKTHSARDWMTPKQLAAQSARLMYQELLKEEAMESVDGLRAEGREIGAAYVVIENSEDETETLSAFPRYFTADGEEVEPDDPTSDAAQAWAGVDLQTLHGEMTGDVDRRGLEANALPSSVQKSAAAIYRCVPETAQD